MKKYSVRGTTVVTVTKEVWANSEEEAYEKAWGNLNSLTAFCGNARRLTVFARVLRY